MNVFIFVQDIYLDYCEKDTKQFPDLICTDQFIQEWLVLEVNEIAVTLL